MAVHNAGAGRMQCSFTAQGGFHGHSLFAGEQDQVVHTIGSGFRGDTLKLGDLIGVGGHNQFATALISQTAGLAIAVQLNFALNAQACLQ